MAESFKDKVEQAGHRIAEKATEVGHKVGEGVEKAADWAKEKAHEAGNRLGEAKDKVVNRVHEAVGSGSCGPAKSNADIRPHMDVVGSCGNKLGVVDCVEGDRVKLTKNDSPDGRHHFIPLGWVECVDSQVRLKKNSVETFQGWKSDAASCDGDV